jgi:hypothetical protein
MLSLIKYHAFFLVGHISIFKLDISIKHTKDTRFMLKEKCTTNNLKWQFQTLPLRLVISMQTVWPKNLYKIETIILNRKLTFNLPASSLSINLIRNNMNERFHQEHQRLFYFLPITIIIIFLNNVHQITK